jgi:hypothetical protein
LLKAFLNYFGCGSRLMIVQQKIPSFLFLVLYTPSIFFRVVYYTLRVPAIVQLNHPPLFF